MTKIDFGILIVATLISLSSMAKSNSQEHPSEYLFLPHSGEQALSLSYIDGRFQGDIKNGSIYGVGSPAANLSGTVNAGTLAYSYGLNDHLVISAGINTGAYNLRTDASPVGGGTTDSKYLGVGDYAFAISGLTGHDGWNLFYNSTYYLSGSIHKNANGIVVGTRTSAQSSLTADVGVARFGDYINFGGLLRSRYYFDGKQLETNNTTSTVKGGTMAGGTVFSEIAYGFGWVGFSYDLLTRQGYTTTSTSGVVSNVESGLTASPTAYIGINAFQSTTATISYSAETYSSPANSNVVLLGSTSTSIKTSYTSVNLRALF